MGFSKCFFTNLLDSMDDQLTVIDACGEIIYSNRSWIAFGEDNQIKGDPSCLGENYLQVCDNAARSGDQDSILVAKGIREVMQGKLPLFEHEYPCSSPTEERWFQMSIKPFRAEQQAYFVITHHNITQRKQAEQKVAQLAILDSLTNIPNRRKFDNFFEQQWAEHARMAKPLTLLMLDIDHFKLINDNYGHDFGDKCLKKLAKMLSQQIKRPYDICARYGGEEFVVLLGHTELEAAVTIGQRLLKLVNQLIIFPAPAIAELKQLSVSIGIASLTPSHNLDRQQLLKRADSLMYDSKHQGRNRLSAANISSEQRLGSPSIDESAICE